MKVWDGELQKQGIIQNALCEVDSQLTISTQEKGLHEQKCSKLFTEDVAQGNLRLERHKLV